MRNKIRLFYQSGTLSEKIISGINGRLTNFSVKSFRYRSKSIHNNCSKVVLDSINTGSIKINTTNTLGDYQHFTKIIDPDLRNKITILAAEFLEHQFNILGSGNIKLDPIDWHSDFKSGFRWNPGKFYKDYKQVDLDNDTDVKVPRELNRFHHLLILGQAYLLTKNEQYTKEFVKQLDNWIDVNPFIHSINWGCVMDVAIRAVNWIVAFAMFANSSHLVDEFKKKFFISLFEHGFFIYNNPKINKINNHNHYLSELCGLIYIAIIFQDISNTKKWLNKGVSELYREIRTQILPTGPSYERSVNYHRLVLEMLSSTIILLSRNNIEVPSDIWLRLEKMFEFVMYYLKPDGSAPIIGDQDDGRFLPFGLQKNIDHRYLLTLGSILFNRSDFKKYSDGFNPASFFHLGSQAKKKFEDIQSCKNCLTSRAFKDAGFYVLRISNNYMFINISGKSRYNEIPSGTHTHSDLLSFVLSVNGKNILIDPGTYLYSADPEFRKQFRSTKMHNTLTVDNEDQNIISEKILWDFKRNAIPKLNKWESTPDYDLFDAEHTGYNRLENPAIHRRKIVFDKKGMSWNITDYITGKGDHEYNLFFHLDEQIDFHILNKHRIKLADSSNIIFDFKADFDFKILKETAFISKAYGLKTEGFVIRINFSGDCPLEFQTIIKEDK